MIRTEQEAVLAVQAEVGCLSALLRCVRTAAESGLPSSLIESAISSCEDLATGIADRIDAIPGLYPKAERTEA